MMGWRGTYRTGQTLICCSRRCYYFRWAREGKRKCGEQREPKDCGVYEAGIYMFPFYLGGMVCRSRDVWVWLYLIVAQ
jgi:hypothetical protein